MKNILLIFALFSTMTTTFGQTKELDSQFFSTVQKYLDKVEGEKINFNKGENNKIVKQLFTPDTIRIYQEFGAYGSESVEEIFNIRWDYDKNYTFFTQNENEKLDRNNPFSTQTSRKNKKLVSFTLGFLFDYSHYYFFTESKEKGELMKSNRVEFHILKTDFYEFREFLESYGIYARLL